MSSKHTPGPWRVQDNTADGPHNQLRVDGMRGAIADLGVNPYVDDEQRANARLIAAAPEMLEALEALIEYAEAHGEMDECLETCGIHTVLKKTGGK